MAAQIHLSFLHIHVELKCTTRVYSIYIRWYDERKSYGCHDTVVLVWYYTNYFGNFSCWLFCSSTTFLWIFDKKCCVVIWVGKSPDYFLLFCWYPRDLHSIPPSTQRSMLIRLWSLIHSRLNRRLFDSVDKCSVFSTTYNIYTLVLKLE